LENKSNNLNIKNKFIISNETIKLIMKDIEEKYKINAIDKITNKYENLIKAVIESKISNNLTKLNSSNIITEFIFDINSIINDYSITLLNEIKSYYSKLKIFGMIDGLNYIKIEKAEKLRVLWDNSDNSNYRNLRKSNRKGKLLNIKKANEYLNKLDKKGKKDILKKMEKIFNNNSSLRHLDEYNTRELFNSKSQPLSLNNISQMIYNLNDDINDFNNMIKNDDYFNKIKVNLDLLKTNIKEDNYIIELNNKILKYELSFISLTNSISIFDYLDELASNEIKDKPEIEVEKLITKLIDFIENKQKLKHLNELSKGIILSTYNTYTNIINKQAKVINTNDVDINYYFNKFIDNVDRLLDIVGIYKIFSKVKKIINNIVDAITVEVDAEIEFFSDELEVSGGVEDFSYGASFDDDKLSIDFNVGSTMGIVIEAGLFFDIKILGFSVSVGVQGNLFEGKVGIKFSIDFTKAQLVLNIYSEFFPLSFEFFIKSIMKVLFVKITLLNLSYKIKTISLHSSEKIILDLYKMIDNFLDDESYYLI